jgi:type IV pilus assembly protein PilE
MHKWFISSGFTLIELLITLTILGILAGIGIPNYQNSFLAAHRDQAKMKLTVISLLETDNFSRHKEYIELNNLAIDLSSDNYQYSIKITANQQYQVIATAIENQRSDRHCRRLSLDHNLTRLPKACW